jgi:hypothetical protein
MGHVSGRQSMLASKARLRDAVSHSLRLKIFGFDSEILSAEASKDHLFKAS